MSRTIKAITNMYFACFAPFTEVESLLAINTLPTHFSTPSSRAYLTFTMGMKRRPLLVISLMGMA